MAAVAEIAAKMRLLRAVFPSSEEDFEPAIAPITKEKSDKSQEKKRENCPNSGIVMRWVSIAVRG